MYFENLKQLFNYLNKVVYTREFQDYRYKYRVTYKTVLLLLYMVSRKRGEDVKIYVNLTPKKNINLGDLILALFNALVDNNFNSDKVYERCEKTRFNHDEYIVKFNSGKAYSYYNNKLDYKKIILINQYGIRLSNNATLILDNCKKHIKDIKQDNNTITLLDFRDIFIKGDEHVSDDDCAFLYNTSILLQLLNN